MLRPLHRSQLTVSAMLSRISTTATYRHLHHTHFQDRHVVRGQRRWDSIAYRLHRLGATGSPRCSFGMLSESFATRPDETDLSPPALGIPMYINLLAVKEFLERCGLLMRRSS